MDKSLQSTSSIKRHLLRSREYIKKIQAHFELHLVHGWCLRFLKGASNAELSFQECFSQEVAP